MAKPCMCPTMQAAGDCALPDTHTTLKRLWAVISNKDSDRQLDRQLILLHTFLKATGESVQIMDLQLISRVLAFLFSKEYVHSEYRGSLQLVLNVLKEPPRMRKSSDKIEFNHHLLELFTTLGCLLIQTKNKYLQSQILEIVQNILFTRRPKGTNMVPVDDCVKCLEVSEFAQCLADAMAIVEAEIYLWTVYSAFQICSKSEYCCWTLLSKGIIDTLIIRLNLEYSKEKWEILDVSSQLLWTLFNCTSHPDDWLKVATPSKLALRTLRNVLREVVLVHKLPGYEHIDLNNFAALLLKIMNLFPKAEYVLSGVIEDITFFATVTEAMVLPKVIPSFKTEKDHLQFKKLMLACLALSPITSQSVEIFERHKVAECLVDLLGKRNSLVSWSFENTLALFNSSLHVIFALHDCLCKGFIVAGLMGQLVHFLKAHYIDSNNTSYEELAQMVVKVMTSLCSRKEMKNYLREADGTSVLLQVCTKNIQPDTALTIPSQSMLFHSLNVLSVLMENNTYLQHEHKDTSLSIVTDLYKRILKPFPTDSLVDNRLIVAVSNFAWEVLIWNKENALRFISSGNLFLHVDILEKSSTSVQLVLLSVLVDICEYHQSIPYLVSWRGPGGIKLLSVLCKIWRSEEETLQVPRTEDKCVLDIERPLMGEDQFRLTDKEKAIVSACDMYASARPKIYAIVQLLQRHKEVTELCEEHYRLGYDKIPCEDQVTLQIIQAYLPLKMGEIWWEIRKKQQDVLPLDRYLAQTLTDRYFHWSLSVQRAQHQLLNTHDAQLRSAELHQYDQMRSGHLTTALEALREVMAVARSADRQILLRTNHRLRERLEASRGTPDEDFRPAYRPDDNVLLVHNKIDLVLSLQADHSATQLP